MMASGMDMVDPTIIRKGIEDIKDSMKDMQREAYMIENEMEKRREAMILKN